MSKFFRLAIGRINYAISTRSASSNPSSDKPTVRRVWRLLFGRYLLITNTVSSGVLMMIGDVAAQAIEMRRDANEKRQYDWRRIGYMTLVGISQGPLHHYLYQWMDRVLPGMDFRTVFKKIGLDQFMMSPIFIVTYMYSAGLLEGSSVQHCSDELVDKFWVIYTADWLVWPPTQFINFYFIGPKHRVLYINAITMLYNIFLCYIKHNDDFRIDSKEKSDKNRIRNEQ